MRYNQFSYFPVSKEDALKELTELGFSLDAASSEKDQFESFVRTCFLITKIRIIHFQLWQWIRKKTYSLSSTLS